jgi:hypothetical protein
VSDGHLKDEKSNQVEVLFGDRCPLEWTTTTQGWGFKSERFFSGDRYEIRFALDIDHAQSEEDKS